jgi:iron-sulfur cluster repair protein YtfE (RIC family)
MPVPPIEQGDESPPFDAMGHYHRRIARVLVGLEALAAEAAATPPPDLPGRIHDVVLALDADLGMHMADEESDIFPTVLAAAGSQARRAQAFALVSALLVEHRELAERWHALRVPLLALGSGINVGFPAEAAQDFIARLRTHLEREDFELGELLRLLDPALSRKIATAIAARHEIARR